MMAGILYRCSIGLAVFTAAIGLTVNTSDAESILANELSGIEILALQPIEDPLKVVAPSKDTWEIMTIDTSNVTSITSCAGYAMSNQEQWRYCETRKDDGSSPEYFWQNAQMQIATKTVEWR